LGQRRFGVKQGFGHVVSQLLKVRVVQLEFLLPSRFVNAGDSFELIGCEAQTGPVQLAIRGCDAEDGFLALSLTL
jgi:hypothetical protein